MLKWFVIGILAFSGALQASEIENVYLRCKAKECELKFIFNKKQKLPAFFYKLKEEKNLVEVGFGNTYLGFKSTHTYDIVNTRFFKQLNIVHSRTKSQKLLKFLFHLRHSKAQRVLEKPGFSAKGYIFKATFENFYKSDLVWDLKSLAKIESGQKREKLDMIHNDEIEDHHHHDHKKEKKENKSKNPAVEKKKDSHKGHDHHKHDGHDHDDQKGNDHHGHDHGKKNKENPRKTQVEKAQIKHPVIGKDGAVSKGEVQGNRGHRHEKPMMVKASDVAAQQAKAKSKANSNLKDSDQVFQLTKSLNEIPDVELLSLNYNQNQRLLSFYLEFDGLHKYVRIGKNNNVIRIFIPKLGYKNKILKSKIPKNAILESLKIMKLDVGSEIRVSINESEHPIKIFQVENRIVFQTFAQDNFLLSSWSSTGRVLKYDRKPEDQNETLEQFFKQINDDHAELSSENTFNLNGGMKEMVIIKDEVMLRDRPSKNSETVQVLGLGQLSHLISRDKKWLFLEVGKKKGYVHYKEIEYKDKLTNVMKQKIAARALAIEMANQKKKQKLELQKLRKSPIIEELIKNSVANMVQTYTYSSYGRRDPFVPVSGPDEGSVNIDGIKLVGIIWDPKEPIAIFEDVRNGGVTYTLQEDDPINNGKIFKITASEVIFQLTEFGVSRRYSMLLPEN